MRCVPGDLAFIYTPPSSSWTNEFQDLLVRCAHIWTTGEFGLKDTKQRYGPWWVVEFQGTRPTYPKHDHHFPKNLGIWPDKWLRPIRFNPGVDEMLAHCRKNSSKLVHPASIKKVV